jgi:adenosine deaminase
MEECCELAMVCSKLLRFGKEEQHLNNLLQEAADVTVMINLLSDYKLVSHIERLEKMFDKQDKLKKWSDVL